MTIKASAVRFPIDAENILRAESAGAITAAEASGSKPLGALSAYWNEGELASPLQLAVVLFVTALDLTTADETYRVDVEVASTETFADAEVVVSSEIKKVGQHVVAFTREQILDALATAAHVRVKITPAGTTPSIDYWAILSPLVDR